MLFCGKPKGSFSVNKGVKQKRHYFFLSKDTPEAAADSSGVDKVNEVPLFAFKSIAVPRSWIRCGFSSALRAQ